MWKGVRKAQQRLGLAKGQHTGESVQDGESPADQGGWTEEPDRK